MGNTNNTQGSNKNINNLLNHPHSTSTLGNSTHNKNKKSNGNHPIDLNDES